MSEEGEGGGGGGGREGPWSTVSVCFTEVSLHLHSIVDSENQARMEGRRPLQLTNPRIFDVSLCLA